VIVLSHEQVARLHTKMIAATGALDGIRGEAALDSALTMAFLSFDGIELYPSTAAKIARITYGIICNHPFIDGNKRIGTYVMLLLLEINRIKTTFSDADVIRTGMELASGKMNDKQLLELIFEHSKRRRIHHQLSSTIRVA